MAVPKGKVSKARKRTRNAACFKASAATMTECQQCHTAVRPHCVCMNCGYYKGVKRVEVAQDAKT